ncbi:MAG: primosomal protein N', partial [Acutalibacteraceae bacterium]|nr:primosomal protein N' [Acutalibacteraceae bacterium]
EDYRSFERTFSLLTQVVGRAGRGESAGKAVVQTVDPDSNIIELAASQDYESFYNEEISVRQLMTFPPYCDICTLVTQSTDKLCAEGAIKEIFDKIKDNLSGDYKDVKIIILGPSAASIPKMNNKYRYRMIIKCKNNRRFREMLRNSISIKAKRDISVLVDINPETVI